MRGNKTSYPQRDSSMVIRLCPNDDNKSLKTVAYIFNVIKEIKQRYINKIKNKKPLKSFAQGNVLQ